MREALGTVVTHERLFAGVDAYVFLQMVFEFKRLPTFGTLELAEDLGLVAGRISLPTNGQSGQQRRDRTHLSRGESVDELVLLELLDLSEGCFAFGTLERLSGQMVGRSGGGQSRRGIDQVRGSDDGVDVGDVFLQIRSRTRSAEQFAAVGTTGRFCSRGIIRGSDD